MRIAINTVIISVNLEGLGPRTYRKLAYAFDDRSLESFMGACGLMLMICATPSITARDVTSGKGEMIDIDAHRLRQRSDTYVMPLRSVSYVRLSSLIQATRIVKGRTAPALRGSVLSTRRANVAMVGGGVLT